MCKSRAPRKHLLTHPWRPGVTGEGWSGAQGGTPTTADTGAWLCAPRDTRPCRGGAGREARLGTPGAPSAHRAMMMTACDLSAITKPWEVQSKVRVMWVPRRLASPHGVASKWGLG